MNVMLAQFLTEAEEYTQQIGDRLMRLESKPNDEALLTELFRFVHTLKGNSGLFNFTHMTGVLHAAEDLLCGIRNGTTPFTQQIADRLLETMDLVAELCGDIRETENIDPGRGPACAQMSAALKALNFAPCADPILKTPAEQPTQESSMPDLAVVPEDIRAVAIRRARYGEEFYWLTYKPLADCFFQGEDPLKDALQTPGALWGRAIPTEAIPSLAVYDTYHCLLAFEILTAGTKAELEEHFCYVLERVGMVPITPLLLTAKGGPQQPKPETVPTETGWSREGVAALKELWAGQRGILLNERPPQGRAGRATAAAAVLKNLALSVGHHAAANGVAAALKASLESSFSGPLLAWMDIYQEIPNQSVALPPAAPTAAPAAPQPAGDEPVRFGRRAEDSTQPSQFLKVDQAKVDRLMSLIGELAVAKNALPYLAAKADSSGNATEIARGIKAQHAILNRIAAEMQDSIMQIRMVAISVVFQRFHRLVRDISRKLGKEVHLILEGEDTEADKNIIESLADPLIHIVRNSLDHGIEMPDVRTASGKPSAGSLTIRAQQQGDRVLIEIIDDGKGIDPHHIKRKALEKGLITTEEASQMSDREAVQLIFAAGFSTAEVVSDLSGRGVGMDVVRSAVEAIQGSVSIDSKPGTGTQIRISLPLSMAVTEVITVESDGQLFGVPMDDVVETVRVPRRSIRSIKQAQTAVLRGRIVPLRTLNGLLGIPAAPLSNLDDELSILLVQTGGEILGLLVDGFRETMSIVQKPLSGILDGLAAFTGSSLLGDGSVLLILNVRELF